MELPTTPGILLDQAAPVTDDEKIRAIAAQFFGIIMESGANGEPEETTRLGIAAAGHFAGVLFGSLYPQGGATAAAAHKKAGKEITQAFQQGMIQARATAAAAAAQQGEG